MNTAKQTIGCGTVAVARNAAQRNEDYKQMARRNAHEHSRADSL